MSPEEFYKKIELIIGMYGEDTEACHAKLDEAMEDLLDGLGYELAVGLIQNTPRWYA